MTNGTLTLSDGVNPVVTRTVNTGSMITVSTGWTLGAARVTIGFTAGWALGLDDIAYAVADPQETTPPTVSMTAPNAGAILSGDVALTANASDNTGVVGVQFLVDGLTAGPENLVAPYAINWDSTTVANGSHTLTARARDTAGNTATSSPGIGVTVSNAAGSSFGNSLRFNGNGVNDIDRVKIRVDDPATNLPGPPVDVGATDFTIEFWVNGTTTEDTAPAIQAGVNDNWILGNIVIDRDRFNQDRAYGVSFGAGRVAFGVKGEGTGNQTIVGTTNVLDNQWHHVAVERRRSDGWMWLYVDGALQASVDGPDGDISYPDNGVPGNFCNGSQPCTNSDPFIVIGAEKHDAGTSFPSYYGLFDELHISTVLRYTSDFTRPTGPFTPDANSVGLYHFDEGTDDYIYDSSNAYGGPSNGVRNFGGSPAGPVWMTQTLTVSASSGPLPGLVASYGMNATTGTAVTDSSGNANNGTVANGTWTTSGRFGSALVFNGTSTLATIANSASLALTTGMTLEAWVYPTIQRTSWHGVIIKEQPGNVLYYLYAGSASSNQPATGLFADGAERTLVGETRLAANTWAHLAATYDGVNQRLYVNGTQVSIRAQTGVMATSTSPLRIGGNSIWGEYFQGRIDEVRIYNRALSAAEVTTDMNTAVP